MVAVFSSSPLLPTCPGLCHSLLRNQWQFLMPTQASWCPDQHLGSSICWLQPTQASICPVYLDLTAYFNLPHVDSHMYATYNHAILIPPFTLAFQVQFISAFLPPPLAASPLTHPFLTFMPFLKHTWLCFLHSSECMHPLNAHIHCSKHVCWMNKSKRKRYCFNKNVF